MKKLQRVLCAFLLAGSLLVPAFAHTHPGDEVVYPTMSSWAQEEVMQAKALNLIPDGLPQDYRTPITRRDFRTIAMNFIAEQQNYSSDCFGRMIIKFLGETDETGTVKQAFTDGETWDTAAYQIGLLQGNGDGTCTPDREITRQEAAVMLTRAYETYAGDLPEAPELTFSDVEEIADWAQDSAALLADWGIMNGLEDGSFAPQENYTVEQCIITFLRLYENGEISRKNGNVTQMFTRDQVMEYIENPTGDEVMADYYSVTATVDGEKADFIRTDIFGVMHGNASFYFVYPDGGVRELDFGLCDAMGIFPTGQDLEDIHFSEDGETFYCTTELTLETRSWADPSNILHEAGTYQIEIDVDTCQIKTELIG